MQLNKNLHHKSRVLYHSWVRKPVLRFCTDVLQRLPLSSERFGPPKGTITSTRQWIEENSGSASYRCRFTPVYPEERLDFVPLRTLENETEFYSFYGRGLDSPLIQKSSNGRYHTNLSATFVAEIPGGRAYGCDGAVITPSDFLLQDLSPEYTANRYMRGKHSVLAQMRLPKVHTVEGSVVMLATLSAQDYFAHWMMDLLPRIGLLEEAGIELEKVDKFFVNSPLLPYQQQTLEALGIPLSKTIDCAAYPHIKADCLIVPSPVSGVFAAGRETCNYLRQNFLDTMAVPDTRSPKRIYVSRASTSHRRIVNENEVVRALSSRGFTVIEPQAMSLAEQSQLFAHAEVIVMSLGSAMANTVYCQPKTKVIEILNPRSVQACTWAVCTQREAEYYFMFAKGTDQSSGELAEDLLVDVEKLTQTLDFADV